MSTASEKVIVVAGGTGNVGGFIVRALLERGHSVAVPSRSAESLADLQAYLASHLATEHLQGLHMFTGTISSEIEGPEIAEEIADTLGEPHSVVALMGSWHGVDSLQEATQADLDYVLEHYLKAHFGVAQALLPHLQEGGTYMSVNGPLAFDVWPGSALVSIATAGQHMLFKALASEYDEHPTSVCELVSHAYIRDRTTQPGSPLPGEGVGAFVAHLLLHGRARLHGESIHLRAMEQLDELGISVAEA